MPQTNALLDQGQHNDFVHFCNGMIDINPMIQSILKNEPRFSNILDMIHFNFAIHTETIWSLCVKRRS